MFEYANDPIFLIRLESVGKFSKIVDVNTAACVKLGFSKEELLELTLEDIDISEDQTFDKIIDKINSVGQYSFERKFKTKHGKHVVFDINAQILEMNEDRFILAIARDIGVKQQSLNDIKFASLGRFAGGIAHNFNNIMAVINGGIELIKGNIYDDHSIKILEIIEKQTLKGGELVRQILDYSGNPFSFEKSVKIADFAIEMTQMLRLLLPSEILLSLSAEDLSVKIDETQLQQVILNLVFNSKDALLDGGEIDLSISRVSFGEVRDFEKTYIRRNNYVKLSVIDNGIGIEEELKKEIFNPFVTSKPFGQGIGLGLSQVYGIVRQHRGYIYIDSTQGIGTETNIFLPEYTGKPIIREEITQTKLDKRVKILLVEDDDDVREITRTAMEYQGFDVVTATNGIEALQVYNDEISLIITDLVMPIMSGIELINEIRSKDESAKIIAITGFPSMKVPKGIQLLQKPVSNKELKEIIEESIV